MARKIRKTIKSVTIRSAIIRKIYTSNKMT
jgi:hypothetical protein